MKQNLASDKPVAYLHTRALVLSNHRSKQWTPHCHKLQIQANESQFF